ncbi:AMP-binding protein [Nocardia sp. CNY236]|uniref:AMP-binding protein n=1 Tax=Nocardia sp. CNY236 TaxID=1169152 RepID=UPI0003F54535|nr:AMP-binding protein [Nocardia sp. CNY236]
MTHQPTHALPLTAAQHGIADAQRLWPDPHTFMVAEYLELRGPIDPDILAEAIGRMITDVAAQRIRLVATPNGPRQVIEPPHTVPVSIHDLTHLDAPDAAALQFMHDDRSQPADPYRSVTTRHHILVLAPDRVYWHHRTHHVALDGYGFALCATRVADHYRALTTADTTVAPLTTDLADVIAEDHAYHASSRCAEDGTYWQTTLTHRSAPTLSTTPSPPTARPLRTRRTPTRWKPTPGSDFGVVEAMVAAAAIYLARRTAENDVVLGVPMMNRIGSAAATVPCTVLNAVALPVQVEPEDTVADLATRIATRLRTARRHGRYRHERLRAELGLIGRGRRLLGPIVNIMPFDYDLALPGIEARAHNLSAGPVEDLSINLYLRGGAAELVVDANPRSYTPQELDHHADALVHALESAATHNTRPVRDLGVTFVPIQAPRPNPALDPITRFRRWAALDPTAPALVTGEHRLSRAELLAQSHSRASELIAIGVDDDDIVAILPSGDGCSDIISILATQLAGAAHVALDLTMPVEDLRALLEALAPSTVIRSPRHIDLAAAVAPGITAIAFPTTQPPATALPETAQPEPTPSRRAAGYAVLTSGTTGTPKAVRVSGAALAAFAADAVDRYQWQPQDRVVQFGPLHADTSIEEIFPTLAAGACVIATNPTQRRSLTDLLDHAHRTEATVLDLPTAIWHELAIAVDAGAITLPATIRQIVIGGEEASPELVARWSRRDNPVLHNSYGPSEAAVVCASTDISADHDPQHPVPLGRLFPRIGAFLAVDRFDPDHGPTVGHLHLYGPMLADGYLPANTATGFRTVQLQHESIRAFATGDRVRVHANGILEFIERSDGVVKIAGHRVGIRTIEDILRREPGVSDALVTRRGEFALDALVTLDIPHPPEWLDTLRQRLSDHIPPAWVPARIIAVDHLPRTSNLKADRTALDAPETRHESRTASGTDQILRVFRTVLGRDDLTAEEDFFAAGGTSMQTIALANRLTVLTGHPITVDEILAHPTAADLAARTTDHTARTDTPDMDREIATLRTLLAASSPPAPPTTPSPGRVLLTGATGFLGAYLLAELLASTDHDIVALIRADSTDHAYDRLRGAFTAVSAAHHFHTAWNARRLSIVLGDCTTPNFGAESAAFAGVSHIVHNAAAISAVRSYQSLRTVNVTAAHHTLRLARDCGAALTLVSTATAAGPRGALAAPATLPTGYAQSKCVAEHLFAVAATEFAVPSTIARLGRVLPHPSDPRDPDHDFLHDLATAATAVGALPHTEVREPMVRADVAAQTIIEATKEAATTTPRILDLLGPEPIAVAAVLAHATTLHTTTIPLARWRAEISACEDIDPPLRTAVQRWCDIQLAGFDPDWTSDHTTPTPELSASDVSDLLRLGNTAP